MAQTVLCDALAVEAVPVEDDELPRWLGGIARHKVVDEHRRRARFVSEEPCEPSAQPNREAEDLLRRIQSEVVEPGERQALDWLVREHEGEALCDMARAEALAPQALRQRLARFRRKLRARYLAPLALLLAFGGAGALWQTKHAAAPAFSLADNGLGAFAGNWQVIDVSPARYRSLDLRVQIGAEGVRVLAAEGVLARSLSVQRVSATNVLVRAGDRSWSCRIESLDADHFKLVSERGYVVLERQR